MADGVKRMPVDQRGAGAVQPARGEEAQRTDGLWGALLGWTVFICGVRRPESGCKAEGA